jgi:hypothetical protein
MILTAPPGSPWRGFFVGIEPRKSRMPPLRRRESLCLQWFRNPGLNRASPLNAGREL